MLFWTFCPFVCFNHCELRLCAHTVLHADIALSSNIAFNSTTKSRTRICGGGFVSITCKYHPLVKDSVGVCVVLMSCGNFLLLSAASMTKGSSIYYIITLGVLADTHLPIVNSHMWWIFILIMICCKIIVDM